MRFATSGVDAVDGSSTGATSAINVGAVRALMIRRSQMQTTPCRNRLSIYSSRSLVGLHTERTRGGCEAPAWVGGAVLVCYRYVGG
jgi:hypothetical protein